MRGIMIAAGAVLVAKFHWILLAFGVFLVYTGLHMLWVRDKSVHYEKNPIFRFASKHLRVTKEYRGERFFLKEGRQRFATPLFLVLLDRGNHRRNLRGGSIRPSSASRAIRFVYTSNVFAILGLARALFPAGGCAGLLSLLSIGLALVLIFIAGKMVAEPWLHISVVLSLSVVGGILLLAV